MKKLASLIVVVATIAAALTITNIANAAVGVGVSVNATNGAVVAPTNVPVKFPQVGIKVEGGMSILGIASNSVTVLAGPIYSNAVNGSLCVTTNGQLWVMTNRVWVAK
jgi:hypothetical protein